MKVLIVYKEKDNDNPFVSTLRKALAAMGADVVCNLNDFWNNFENYDLIHIQWPESLIRELKLSEREYSAIIEQIQLVKSRCKLLATCHNLKPHYSNNQYKDLLYEYVYSHCDAIIHLGEYSLEYLIKVVPPTVKHYLVPHHVYDAIYHFSSNKTEARQKLKIPPEANVLLCFGTFRSNEERKMVLDAFNSLKLKDKYLLVPGFYRATIIRKNVFLGLKAFLNVVYYKIKGVHLSTEFLSDDEVETYLCAADILMIQRCKILNSGNLPLGYWAKKVVIGPNIGNVGILLNKTNNPVFEPDDISSIALAIEEGFRLKNTNLPEKNYQYAFENWRTLIVARQLYEIYKNEVK